MSQQHDMFDFLVTMQAQREAPPDMQCKDKFLVQSVILPDDIKDKEVSQEFVSSHNFSLFSNVMMFLMLIKFYVLAR